MTKDKEKKKIGILNQGKNNQFINNRFEGHDVGIQDEGEGTLAEGNEFDTNTHRVVREKCYQKWWGQIIIGLIVLIVGGFILFIFGWN